MGRDIHASEFTGADFANFGAALARQSNIVRERMRYDPRWNTDPHTLGGETEYVIANRGNGSPLCIAHEVLPRTGWEKELGSWNVEHGNQIVSVAGRPFSAMLEELNVEQAAMDATLHSHGGVTGAFGIMPSLTPAHLGHLYVAERFRALETQMDANYGPYRLDLGSGAERLVYTGHGIDIEALTTTRQLHISTSITQAPALINAVKLAASVLIGLSGNSPFLFGRRVCSNEARLLVFAESVRHRGQGLGTRWIDHPMDQIIDALRSPALLPVVSGKPDEELMELTLHLGTYWCYIRLVLSDQLIRVEIRFMPAGPSNVDMVANDAATLALISWLMPQIPGWIADGLPFHAISNNLDSAILHGPNAPIWWPNSRGILEATTPANVVLRLEEPLHQALVDLDIDDQEASTHLGPFFRRAETGRTGARWLLEAAQRFPQTSRMDQVTRAAIQAASSGLPVVDWDLP